MHKRCDEILPEKEDKNAMIVTLLGMSGVIVEWLANNFIIDDMPIMIKYSCANILGNLRVFFSQEKEVSKLDLTDFELGEQTEEVLYRKFIFIIKYLYASISEEEKNSP